MWKGFIFSSSFMVGGSKNCGESAMKDFPLSLTVFTKSNVRCGPLNRATRNFTDRWLGFRRPGAWSSQIKLSINFSHFLSPSFTIPTDLSNYSNLPRQGFTTVDECLHFDTQRSVQGDLMLDSREGIATLTRLLFHRSNQMRKESVHHQLRRGSSR